MRNILFSTHYTGLGGGETDLLTLAAALPQDTYRCHLLVPREGQLAQRWREQGGIAHVVPFRGVTTLFVPSLWTRFPVVAKIGQLLRDQHIDLVHADYHSLPFVWAAAKQTQVACVWTVHGWWFHPRRWQRDFFRKIPIVARSYSIREGFVGKPPFMPINDIPVIYSGVDTERFSPQRTTQLHDTLKIPHDAPVVAMVARFQSVKGHDTFQQMARQVALQRPETHFIVAGENVFGVAADQTTRETTLRNAMSDPLLRPRLHYIGFRDDVETVYNSADVVVCASDFESYGKANLEAMACAVPVVSTNAGGPSETVLDAETGYLVAPRDVASMSVRVLELLNDAPLRERMGKAGRAHILKHFSVGEMVKQYVEVFDRVRIL
jgi:glycosyltransferase involved in cell wall biosynthesis